MTEEQKRGFAKQNMVIVQGIPFSETSTCNIKRCKRKQKFSFFIGESPRLSTYWGSCCEKHSTLMIQQTTEKAKEFLNKMLADAEKREQENAIKVLAEKL